jgi:F0F1-type ATP synthase assembly protein I
MELEDNLGTEEPAPPPAATPFPPGYVQIGRPMDLPQLTDTTPRIMDIEAQIVNNPTMLITKLLNDIAAKCQAYQELYHSAERRNHIFLQLLTISLVVFSSIGAVLSYLLLKFNNSVALQIIIVILNTITMALSGAQKTRDFAKYKKQNQDAADSCAELLLSIYRRIVFMHKYTIQELEEFHESASKALINIRRDSPSIANTFIRDKISKLSDPKVKLDDLTRLEGITTKNACRIRKSGKLTNLS